MRHILIALCSIIATTTQAQPVALAWAHAFNFGDNTNLKEKDIAVGPGGEVLVVGSTNIAVDLDPGPGTELFTPSQSFGEGVVLKLDADGNHLWAVGMGYRAEKVVVDAEGNVYVAGFYQDIYDLDPGPEVLRPTTGQDPSIYLAKLDINGALVWANVVRCAGTTPEIVVDALALSPDGSIFMAGLFDGNADFDPGPGEVMLTSAPCFLCSESFLVKYDSDGALVRSQQLRIAVPMANGAARILSLAIDASGDLYATGHYNSTIDFDPGAGTYLDDGTVAESFLLKLDATGTFAWMLPLGTEQNTTVEHVAVDASGEHATVAGRFMGTTDLDPGEGTSIFTANGGADVCVVQFNSDGTFNWARTYSGTQDEDMHDLHVSANGDVYILGYFSYGYLDLDPGAGSVEFSETESAFLSVLDTDGDYRWSAALEATTGTVNRCHMAIHAGGDIHFTGRNAANVDFDPGPGTSFLQPTGNASFVAKWHSTTTTVPALSNAPFILYPNPAQEHLFIHHTGTDHDLLITIRDTQGRAVHMTRSPSNGTLTIPLTGAPGVYTITLHDVSGPHTARFIKQ